MIINSNKSKYSKLYLDKINEAYSYALKYLKVKCKDVEINLDFVSKKKIKHLNKNFRNIDKVTDVLSFPNLLEPGRQNMQLIVNKLNKTNFASEINPENGHIFLGDICLCIPVAYKQAKEYGNSRIREVVYLSLHGLLHLLGYDHMLEEDKDVMREVEEKIMKRIGVERI